MVAVQSEIPSYVLWQPLVWCPKLQHIHTLKPIERRGEHTRDEIIALNGSRLML